MDRLSEAEVTELRELRKKHRQNTHQAAESVGVNQSTYLRMEGRRDIAPEAETVLRMRIYLDNLRKLKPILELAKVSEEEIGRRTRQIQCPKCRAVVHAGSFCSACGTPIE